MNHLPDSLETLSIELADHQFSDHLKESIFLPLTQLPNLHTLKIHCTYLNKVGDFNFLRECKKLCFLDVCHTLNMCDRSQIVLNLPLSLERMTLYDDDLRSFSENDWEFITNHKKLSHIHIAEARPWVLESVKSKLEALMQKKRPITITTPRGPALSVRSLNALCNLQKKALPNGDDSSDGDDDSSDDFDQ